MTRRKFSNAESQQKMAENEIIKYLAQLEQDSHRTVIKLLKIIKRNKILLIHQEEAIDAELKERARLIEKVEFERAAAHAAAKYHRKILVITTAPI